MDDWEKFNEILLPEKEDFSCHLNMEDITDADYAQAKRVFKDFNIKNFGKYYDLYVRSIHYCYQMYLRTLEILLIVEKGIRGGICHSIYR